MSENNSQAQVQEQSIQLTLTPEETRAEQEQQLNELTEKKEEEAAKVAPQKTIEEMLDDAKLNDAEKKQVNDFSETIDIMQANAILNYGSAAQKKITDFSDAALKNVKTRDLGEIGDLLGQLVGELKDADPNQKEEKKGISSDIRDIYAEAKGVGFDVKIMKAIIKLRKMNQADRDEQEFLLETYRKALNV